MRSAQLLLENLPDIFWVNFFGSELVNWFGATKFLDLPCYEQKSLDNGGRLVQLTLDVEDVDTIAKRKRSVKARLGRRAFEGWNVFGYRSPFKDGTLSLIPEPNAWPRRLELLAQELGWDS